MQPSEQHPAMSRPCSRVKGKRGRAFGAPTGVVPRIASVRPRTAGVFYFGFVPVARPWAYAPLSGSGRRRMQSDLPARYPFMQHKKERIEQ